MRSEGCTIGLRFIIDEWQQVGLVRDLAGLVEFGRTTKPADQSPVADGTEREETDAEREVAVDAYLPDARRPA